MIIYLFLYMQSEQYSYLFQSLAVIYRNFSKLKVNTEKIKKIPSKASRWPIYLVLCLARKLASLTRANLTLNLRTGACPCERGTMKGRWANVHVVRKKNHEKSASKTIFYKRGFFMYQSCSYWLRRAQKAQFICQCIRQFAIFQKVNIGKVHYLCQM